MLDDNKTTEAVLITKEEWDKCVMQVCEENERLGREKGTGFGAMMFSMTGMLFACEMWKLMTKEKGENE